MNPILKAALWMSGSIASFSAMAVAGREVASQLDTFEIMMYRSLVGVVIVCLVAGVTGTWRQVNTQQMGTHLIRNAAHFTGQNLWFYAVTLIPLAQVFALEFTSPIWVIVLSPLILGERLTSMRVLAALLGFVGILIVARPDVGAINAGVVTAASAAIFFALTIMFTKRLTRTQSLPWLTLIGLAGLLAHFCLTNALKIAPATVVVPIDFIRLPTIAVVGMLVYNESIDIWVFVGAAVIFAGNYMNIWFETRRR